MKRTSGQQRGIVAVVVAMALLVLLAMAGLAIDIGHLVLNKSRLQSTVDAAALAAAKTLDQAGSEDQATAAAHSTFDLNAAKFPELVTSWCGHPGAVFAHAEPVRAWEHTCRLRAGACRKLLHVDQFHAAHRVRRDDHARERGGGSQRADRQSVRPLPGGRVRGLDPGPATLGLCAVWRGRQHRYAAEARLGCRRRDVRAGQLPADPPGRHRGGRRSKEHGGRRGLRRGGQWWRSIRSRATLPGRLPQGANTRFGITTARSARGGRLSTRPGHDPSPAHCHSTSADGATDHPTTASRSPASISLPIRT